MKPRKPPRRCVACGATYHKTGSAKTCGADECRAEVVRLRHERWRREHPERWGEFFERYRKANLPRVAAMMRARRARLKAEGDGAHN